MAVAANSQWSQTAFETDQRDLADLWNEAQLRFKSIVGGDYVKFTNTQAIMQYGTDQMNTFHHFRHNQGKVDKLRTLFALNMSYIETSTAAIASAASGAFPPAAAIGTAIAFVLGVSGIVAAASRVLMIPDQACKKVSADYDLVTDFFEDMNNFLQRVSIIERHVPASRPYQNSLVEVFGSLLDMCARAGKEIQTGRLKKWLLQTLSIDHADIGGSKKRMETALSRLQSATEFAILGNTEQLKDFSRELQQNQKEHKKLLEAQKILIESGFESMNADLRKIIVMLQKQQEPGTNIVIAPDRDQIATTRKVEIFLDFSLNVLERAFDDTRDSFVSGTCDWFFKESAWEKWLSHDSMSPKLLFVSGVRGSGKTHLVVRIYERLRELARPRPSTAQTCVGCVLFRDRVEGLQDLYSAMAAITVQIAQQSPRICKRINADMARPDNGGAGADWKNVWTKYVAVHFQEGSSDYLRLIFDGADELPALEMAKFIEFVNILTASQSVQIDVIVSFRPEQASNNQPLATSIVTMKAQKQKNDYSTIIENRMAASRRLRSLDSDVKQKIAQKLEKESDSVLYMEYMLRNLKTFTRRSTLLKQLNATSPPDLDHIYTSLLGDYERRLAKEQLAAAKMIFMWVAFARVHPTVDEITALLRHAGYQDFVLEEELQQSQMRRFLVLKPSTRRGESALNHRHNALELIQQIGDDTKDDDDIMLVHFWDKSMKDFFRSLLHYDSGLRTAESEAHRRIFILCSEILQSSNEVQPSLLKYASGYWLAHHASVNFGDHSQMEQVEFLEATALLLHDSSNLTRSLVAADTDFIQIRENLGGDDDALLSIANCVEKSTPRHLEKLSANACSWLAAVKVDSEKMLLPVARGLINHWLQTKTIEQMHEPYWYVRSCVIVAGLPPFNSPNADAEDYRDVSKSTYMGFTTSFRRLSFEELKTIVGLLQRELTLDEYIVLYQTSSKRCDAMEATVEEFKNIVSNSATGSQGLSKARIVLGVILQYFARTFKYYADAREHRELAVRSITEALRDTSLPSSVLALGYATLADVNFQLEQREKGFVAHAKVREFSGTEFIDGNTLKAELRRMRYHRTEEECSNLVKSWRPVDALAYMTENFYQKETYHMALRRMAAVVSDRRFLIDRYQEVIQVLETLQSAAPIQIELATCYRYVYDNIGAARKTLEQVLDGSAREGLYMLTNEEPEWAFGQAVDKMCDILYEEFRSAPNSDQKAKVYEETKRLLSRNLATYVNSSANTLLHHTITVARMAKRLGPASEFQRILSQAFDTCYESLTDNIEWNDRTSLIGLCKILALMDGFEDDMAVAMSARFSALDVLGEDEGHDGSRGDGRKSKNVDRDDRRDDFRRYDHSHIKNFNYTGERSFCDGSICSPNLTFTWYGGSVAYDCLICSSCFLCERCYDKRQVWNQRETTESAASSGSRASYRLLFCGSNHKYVKGPMAGWRGLKNGIMYIDGRPPVRFVDWLRQLKYEKWPSAWKRFWLAEG